MHGETFGEHCVHKQNKMCVYECVWVWVYFGASSYAC